MRWWVSIAALLAAADAPAGVEVVIACGSQGDDQVSCQTGAEAWAKSTGNTVKLVAVPTDSGQQLTQFQQLFAAQSSDVDVFRLDIVWPGMVAGHMVDLKPHVTDAELKQYFDPIVQAVTVDAKLVALPWFTDAGLLYYRKDLLEKYGQKPPATWQELAATAKLIREQERAAGNKRLVGFVFQGKAYEGLTCNALEWIDAFGGGTVVADDGRITVNNPKAVAAIEFAASLIGGASPKGVLNYDEESARGAFQSAQAVFMRNWPYAWAKAQNADSLIKDKVGVMALPPGGPDGKSTGALGGWNLGVSRYSKQQEAAISLVKYLTGPQEQKRRALEYAANPTIAALYQDADILKANPFMGTLSKTFANAVARPSKRTGRKYNQVSAELQSAVHAALAGTEQAGPALQKLTEKLEKISNGGKW
ncbi:MAG TPA: ABC transporter substrate-binding protein [Myxococcaceae bacterium]|jgi:trehalose/maltose transport system substrate-binding protein